MASTAFAATGGTDILVLAVAFTLLLPALPCVLYRLVPLLRHPSSLQTAQNAALALATAVALALYALAALVALSGTGSWTVAVASGAFGCLSVTLSESLHRSPSLNSRASGAHWAFHPTPFGLIRITSRSQAI
jgi:hypothetical protein